MAVLLQDNFDRADSTSVVGSPQIGPAPVVALGTAGISINRLYATALPANVTYELGTPDAEISFANGGGASGTPSVILGHASTTDFYMVTFQPAYPVQLIQTTAGGQNIIYTSSVRMPVVSTSLCRAHYKDGIIRAYVDDVLVLRWMLSAPITATKHGVRLAVNATARVDNLLGTDAPVIAEPVQNGTEPPAGALRVAVPPFISPSFAYLGRDTKLQDISVGA